MPATHATAIRRKAGHPIIDADAHVQEVIPVFLDYVREVGGASVMERYEQALYRSESFGPSALWYRMTDAERRDTRTMVPNWWVRPTRNVLDRTTASLPKLLYSRLEEFGLDYAILYPTNLLGIVSYQDEEMRRVGARAFNMHRADTFRPFADRLTPAALIPMHTPQEAIEELTFAVRTLGLKVAMLAGHVQRPIPALHRKHPGLSGAGYWVDTFGIDSEYDYDPVWAACVELGVAPSQHLGSYGWGARTSISNFMHNGAGHFAAAGEALCKSLFMGGVTRRFPRLGYAFLEGGAGWGCSLYAEMVGRWRKRNPTALMQHLDPAALDVDRLVRYFTDFGDDKTVAKLDEIRDYVSWPQPRPDQIDDFARCRIERVEDVRDLFAPRFYFGCEGDDPLLPWAFNTKVNPLNARLRAFFGSDIGHWDIQDMREVVEEAYAPVERGLMTPDDFRDFTFAHAVALYGGMNPDFFKGTAIERDAARQLQAAP